jgi:hypothetical protein
MDSGELTGQRLVRRNPQVAVPLLVVAVLSALALVFELLRANQSAVSRVRDWPWNVQTLGTAAWVSLLVAAGLAWLGRDQFARNVRPLVGYDSLWRRDADDLVDGVGPFREVTIRNVGPGAAVIARTRWIVRPASAREDIELTTLGGVYDTLSRLDLRESRDYYLVNFSPGAPLAPGAEERYFVCTEAAIKAFARFDLVLEFESLLGDRFERRVWLLPRPDAPSAVLPTEAGRPH